MNLATSIGGSATRYHSRVRGHNKKPHPIDKLGRSYTYDIVR